jgi:hypothetical protein
MAVSTGNDNERRDFIMELELHPIEEIEQNLKLEGSGSVEQASLTGLASYSATGLVGLSASGLMMMSANGLAGY